MAVRASIVGAAVSHVGKVRDHNEDAHFLDADAGLFVVCDGMGGHAAGEVASALAVQTVRAKWLDDGVRQLADAWLAQRTADAKKKLFGAIRAGVIAAHDLILAEGAADDAKSGMGTTLVGAIAVGNELVFAHAGDSRAYLVRDGIAMQLTEDHTLLARLLAAGIDVDVSGEGARFRSMLTNALGIGQECKVATFAVPLADGDRFLLCSDGISEYVPEAEVGTVLTKHPTPARAAEQLVHLALARGGADNATAVVFRVVEAGEGPQPAEHRRLDDEAIGRCLLWSGKISPQQRLRALRIAIPRDHGAGERIPAHTLGDRVAWIVLEGAVSHDGKELGPGALLYPESLVSNAPAPERDALASARSDVRALALRADDFRELCDDDVELGETLLETVGGLVSGRRRGGRPTRPSERADTELERGRPPSNSDVIDPPPPVMAPLPISGRKSAPAAAGAGKEPAPRPTPRTAPPHPPPGAPSARPSQPSASGLARPSTPPPPPRGSDPDLRRSLQPAPPQPDPDPSSVDGDDATLFDPATLAEGLDADLGVPEPTSSPRFPRAPSEPEIETFYEVDGEPPPPPGPSDTIIDDDDDPIMEMTVSMDDGEAVVTETITETEEATLTLTLTQSAPIDDDEEPTRIHMIDAEDGPGASSTMPMAAREPLPLPPPPAPASAPPPSRRPKRVSDGGLED